MNGHRVRRVEDTYALSPMQQGMLFHTVFSQQPGVEIEQIIGQLREDLDVPALRRAWEHVAQTHPILRTAFQWEGLNEPVQEVWSEINLAFVSHDWRGWLGAEQELQLAAFLEADRRRGFAMTEPPLFRLTLFRCADRDYRLVWTFHHALLDGRSFLLVLREVFACYEAFRHGKEREAGNSRPYREYIEWLKQQEFSKTETFWRRYLQGFVAPTPLVIELPPTDKAASPAVQTVRLSADLTHSLEVLAKTRGLTLNTIVQGAWALLLHRYSGEEDVLFGATRACRRSSIEGADAMVGLFINTVPVRAHVPPNAELIPWLQGLRSQWVTLREYEHTPLVLIQKCSELPPGSSLFQSIVVFENSCLHDELRAQGGQWTQREFDLVEQPFYPITLAACGGAELSLKIEYQPQRFDAGSISRMLCHLQTLLEQFATNPSQRLDRMRLLTDAERHQLLVEWNPAIAGQSPFPYGPTLHQMFESQVERTPEAIAVVCENEHLTYRELNERANQAAHLLRERGVGPEVVVGLCLDRSLGLIVGVLAILKAGGAYLPIDLSYPAERVALILEDAKAPVLLTRQKLAASLPAMHAKVLCIDAPQPATQPPKPTSNPNSGATADSLAYVIYTSGSTGKPKGVLVTHQNVTRLFHATHHWFQFKPTDVWTLFHSIAFDFSVWEIWGALLHGGRVVVVPYLTSRSPDAFYDLLRREKVTVLNQTPSAFRQLIPVDQRDADHDSLALRYVIFGGEALEMQSLKAWFDRHGDQRPKLINMYGITETTVHTTYRPLSKDDLASSSVIGGPLPDLQIYILDRELQPVPIGVPGEIYVGGAGLARGYLNSPELTHERFVLNPFSGPPDARLYKTGDRARFLPNHDIEYLGRTDQQVKIRGFRVEPGEIESALGRHPAVREAVVLCREDTPGDKRLVAYLVASRPTLTADELRALLRGQLPGYMVPMAYLFLERLPLTNNGKLDRKALPAPPAARLDSIKSFAPPRTHLERAIAGVWQQALKVEKLGLDENFFDAGGHSLLMVQVHGMLRGAMELDAPITTLFQFPTIRSLARHLNEGTAVQEAAERVRARARHMREAEEVGA